MSWFNFFKKADGTAQVAKDRLSIIVAREPVKALPKVDSLSDPSSRTVEIKY